MGAAKKETKHLNVLYAKNGCTTIRYDMIWLNALDRCSFEGQQKKSIKNSLHSK